MITASLARRTLGAIVVTAVATAVVARVDTAAAASQPHVMDNLATAKWGPAPPMLPPGAQIAVLAGDPTSQGTYAVRLKFPANYTVPPHSHPTDEHVVVVSGELRMGMGETIDKARAMSLGVGGFALMPAHANHYAFTNAETTIVLYGQGPVEFTYVKASDDPRTKTSTNNR
jgi:quercetin dioxygenase-like cupin family protein